MQQKIQRVTMKQGKTKDKHYGLWMLMKYITDNEGSVMLHSLSLAFMAVRPYFLPCVIVWYNFTSKQYTSTSTTTSTSTSCGKMIPSSVPITRKSLSKCPLVQQP